MPISAHQADCDIRDYGKKVQQLEIGFDETNDKLSKVREKERWILYIFYRIYYWILIPYFGYKSNVNNI